VIQMSHSTSLVHITNAPLGIYTPPYQKTSNSLLMHLKLTMAKQHLSVTTKVNPLTNAPKKFTKKIVKVAL
jgi:hypothetical protein